MRTSANDLSGVIDAESLLQHPSRSCRDQFVKIFDLGGELTTLYNFCSQSARLGHCDRRTQRRC